MYQKQESKIAKESDGEKYEEARSLNQELTFKASKEFFEKENTPWGENQQELLRLKTADSIYTNLGLLLSDQSANTIKLAVFEGHEKEIFKDRREFSGSLLKQLSDAYNVLDMCNRTRAEIKGLTRVEQRDYPEDALREALLNALVHRDYSYSSSILISIFDNRIEFVSIGGLPNGVTLDDIMLGLSVPRNENLAAVFCRLRLTEAYGTGIPKIMRSYAHCLRKPELQATANAFKITLPNQNVGYAHNAQYQYPEPYSLPNNAGMVQSAAGRYYNQRNTSYTAMLTESEEKAFCLLESKNEIVRKDVEAALSVSQAMAVRVLRGLVDKGALRVIGNGKNTRYRKAGAAL